MVTKFESDISTLLKWFAKNGMVANPKKFQLIFLGLIMYRGLRLDIEGNKVSGADCAKLLGIEMDNKLKFDKHITALYSKVSKKISAFSKLTTHIP